MSKSLARFNVTKTIGHFELGQVLGEGGFGKVYLGYDTIKKEEVAVKFIDKKLIQEGNLQEYVDREVEVMKKIKHNHIVALYSVINSNKGYYLVMELAANGELFDRIVESKRFDEDTARRYFQQLMSAVKYCHELGIVHRDLKAENLLLGVDNNLRVCDFGLSRYTSQAGAGDKKVLMQSLAGSVDYQAPEVIKEEGYQGFSCDIWSCGVILFFMVVGYLPFAARGGVKETQQRILSGVYNKDNKYMSDGLKDLVRRILEVDPEKRYTIDDIITHPWFTINLDKSLFPDIAARLSPTLTSPAGFIHEMNSPHISTPINPEDVQNLNYRDKLHHAFLSINYDHSGFLSKSQIKDMLVKIHECAVTDKEVDEFVNNFEHDSDGRITEEQFVIGWTRNQKHIDSKLDLHKLINLFHYDLEAALLQTLHAAFDKLDRAHEGILTEEDFREVGRKELEITEAEASELFNMMHSQCASGVSSTNGKGSRIDFEAFVRFCTEKNFLATHPLAKRLNRVREMFDASDALYYKNYISTGFTVRGLREQVANKILELGPKYDTEINKGENSEGFFYATHTTSVDGRKIVVRMGIQLMPAAAGYCKVKAYRIGGKTEAFHEWFRLLRDMLREEIQACDEDTAVVGESELL